MNSLAETQWAEYLETPRRANGPVKLDKILEERLQVFLKARKVKPMRWTRRA